MYIGPSGVSSYQPIPSMKDISDVSSYQPIPSMKDISDGSRYYNNRFGIRYDSSPSNIYWEFGSE